MITLNNVKLKVFESQDTLLKKAIKLSGNKNLKHVKILKKSIDARDKSNIFYVYNILASETPIVDAKKEYGKIAKKGNILVVGAGPCGLFCALDLVRYGFSVTLIERGDKVEDRQVKVNAFIKDKILDTESNVQFGEGGAGAFSDGKLNTQVNSPYVKEVVNDFVLFGAPKEIAYLAKPHIGSDNLPKVVKNIRNEIIKLGGKVCFRTALTDIDIKNGKVESVKINGKTEYFDQVVLAVGHSARDVFELLNEKGVFLESKNFAVGFRIEHLQKDINISQYSEKYANILPPAEYKLVSHASDKGAFTFCMCPGGVVMPSSSSKNSVVVNGMSNFKRDGVNSNSAIIIQVDKNDFSNDLFGGLDYQKSLEEKAFILGGENYKAPIQLVGDYLKNQKSSMLGKVNPSYEIGYTFSNLHSLLSTSLNQKLCLAITDMGKKLKGFDSYDAVLTGVETRTSSPIKVTRGENYNSVNVENLYPCGEGCGYAGGISSAGADGKKVAYSLALKYGLKPTK